MKEVNKVVQIYTCKKQQSVSQKPHKQCDLRRTGRRPVHTNTTVTAVKCWLKLLEQPYGRLPKAAYETLKMTDEKRHFHMGDYVKNHSLSFGVWKELYRSRTG